MHRVDQPGNPRGRKEFRLPVGLVILDTFSKAIAAGGGDEDKARDQNRVAANLRRLHEMFEIHIALVGHTGKNERRGARGSNAHLGDIDVMAQISGDLVKRVEIIAANDQPERQLAEFRLDVFNVGLDDEGVAVTTAIVSTETVTAGPPKASEPKLGKSERTMFGILCEASMGMTTQQWNDAGRASGIGINRRADLHDAQQGLKRKKMVREFNDRWHVNHNTS
jgi:hypothetical protein